MSEVRNLNPTQPAVAAMYLWGSHYARSRKGSMDFWDSLNESEQALCRELVKAIMNAKPEKLP